MKFSDISLPEEYLSSMDFRFFLKWFGHSLMKTQVDTEEFFDLYDPLRCPRDLLWCLADTMGFKYDDRLSPAFNRLVLVYFMSMIRNKGSKDGVTLAAEVNLAQFSLIRKAQEYYNQSNIEEGTTYHDAILEDRLEDTSIPVNSVYVTPYTSKGYIEVVYFSEEKPIDACIEYVRPLGMYIFQSSGVRFDGRTKITIDARLTNIREMSTSIGPTHVGHYSREDYARMQKITSEEYADLLNRAEYRVGGYREHTPPSHTAPFSPEVISSHTRRDVYRANSKAEGHTSPNINKGYRALYSLQLCNNENIVRSLIPHIFGLGYNPQDPSKPDVYINGINYRTSNDPNEPMEYPDGPTKAEVDLVSPKYNLRYNKYRDEHWMDDTVSSDVYQLEPGSERIKPIPAVNAIMAKVGDALWSEAKADGGMGEDIVTPHDDVPDDGE